MCDECRWAAIASYLPQRTDNDIKNYWNTHLRKKLKKIQTGASSSDDEKVNSCNSSELKGQWERRLQTDIHMAKQALCEALSLDKPTQIFPETKMPSNSHNHHPTITSPYQTTLSSTTTTTTTTSLYASSTENIAKLLENWMKKSPTNTTETNSFNMVVATAGSSSSEGTTQSTITCTQQDHALESLWSFNDSDRSQSEENTNCESKPNQLEAQVPLMLLENWLFDDMSLEESTQGLF